MGDKFDQMIRPVESQPKLGPGQRVTVPFRHPTPRSDWATPLLVALTISLLMGLGAAWFTWQDGGDWAKIGVSVFLILAPISFIVALNRFNRSLFHSLEEKRKKDPKAERPIVLNRGGQAVNPQTEEAAVEGRGCPYPEKTMQWFVWHAEDIGTGHEVWQAQRIGRKKYTYWRDSLLDSGWAEWLVYGPEGKHRPTKGWKLTASREEICRNINSS